MCAVLGCARSRELFPSSICSSTSCRRLALDSAGEPEPSDRRKHRSARTIQAIPPRKSGFFGSRTTLETCLACPRTMRSRTSPAAPHPSSNGCPLSKRGAATNRKPICRLTLASGIFAFGTAGRPSCSRISAARGPRVRVLRRSAKIGGIWRNPRCFPSIDHLLWPGRTCALRGLRVGFCPQLFTSLWTEYGAFFVPRLAVGLDGPPAARARSPLCCDEPKLIRTGRWLPIRQIGRAHV